MVLVEKQIEALVKLVSTGVDSGVDVLNAMLGHTIALEIPSIEVINGDQAVKETPNNEDHGLAVVEMEFGGSITGNSGLVFSKDSAWKFVEKVAGDDADSGDFDFVSKGVLTEIGNVVLNRVLGAISNALSISLDYVMPQFYHGEIKQPWSADTTEMKGLLVKTRFLVEDLATDGNIIIFFDRDSFTALMSLVEGLDDLDL